MATILSREDEEALAFYTVESKEQNAFTPYVKQVKLYGGTRRAPKWLPSKRYVFPQGKRSLPAKKGSPVNLEYCGTHTGVQQEILTVLRRRREEYQYGCGLVRLGTGKGKSHIIMGIVSEMGMSTLILCHNVKTLKEMHQKFMAFTAWDGKKTDVGLWYGQKKRLAPITVSTHDSFVNAGGKLGDFQLLIVDECDTNLSPAFINALANSGADYLYGLTGTAYRKNLDNDDMQKLYGKEVSSGMATYEYVPEVTLLKYKSPKYEYETFAELKTLMVEDEARVRAQARAVESLRHHRDCVLVLTERVEEANKYAALIPDSILITGETKEKDDEEALKAVYRPADKGHVIIGTVGKMARGVDIPPIDTVCLFAALHFKGTVVQAVGRALRRWESKTDVRIYDWGDTAIGKQQYGRSISYMQEYGLRKDELEVCAAIDYGNSCTEAVQAGEGIPGTVPKAPKGQLMLGT